MNDQAARIPCTTLLFPGPVTGARTAWLITYTPAVDEPRLVRQATSLAQSGWRVVVCGYEGRSSKPDAWTFLSLARSIEAPGRRLALQRRIGHAIVRRSTGAAIQFGARIYYHGIPDWRRHHADIVRVARENAELRPNLIIAHDYYTCPPADALARAYRAPVIIDSHEYMLGARLESPDWVANQRPVIQAMQDEYFARADQVITVSQGIADRLNAEQKMKRPAKVVRNTPLYQPLPFRPVRDMITILYHGIIDPVRNLEPAIEAAARWNSKARLVLRGPCPSDYRRHLQALIAARGLEGRVVIEPPVAYTDMVARANEADVGYFVYAGGSAQREHVLPNKFFEYVMAGLALCVSDLPEMAHLLQRYDLGVAVRGLDAQTIAAAVDGLTPPRIEAFKRASLAAAHDLNWEREQAGFLETVDLVCQAE